MSSYRTGPTTARLEHRALTADDAEAFFALNSHPEVMRFTGEPPLRSLQEARDAIASYPDFDRVGYGRWACALKDRPCCSMKSADSPNAEQPAPAHSPASSCLRSAGPQDCAAQIAQKPTGTGSSSLHRVARPSQRSVCQTAIRGAGNMKQGSSVGHSENTTAADRRVYWPWVSERDGEASLPYPHENTPDIGDGWLPHADHGRRCQ